MPEKRPYIARNGGNAFPKGRERSPNLPLPLGSDYFSVWASRRRWAGNVRPFSGQEL